MVVSLGVVDDLGFNGEILDSFPGSLNGLVLDDGLFDFLGDVLDLGFDGVVVGDGPFDRHSLGSLDFLVLHDFPLVGHLLDVLNLVVLDVLLFERNVLDPALDGDLLSHHFLVMDARSLQLGGALVGHGLSSISLSSGAGRVLASVLGVARGGTLGVASHNQLLVSS